MRHPAILLTATLRWPIAARLASAFAELGCRVEVLCPRGHPAQHGRAAYRLHAHAGFNPLPALRAAIAAAAPDLVIPCDDDAALQLQRLHRQAADAGAADLPLKLLIERSLGTPEACALATSRGRLLALAAGLGVRVPDTAEIDTPAALDAWLAAHALPAVLKIDGSWGGQGVALVHSRDEAQRAFERLGARPWLPGALVHALLERDASLITRALHPPARRVTLQPFVAGTPANRAVACWQGRVLAGTSVAALHTQHPTGPATVVRVIDHPAMADAAQRLVQHLGLSGLWGLDFMLDAATGAAFLIEVNPRATPICHLNLGDGHDLPAALCTQLAGAGAARQGAPIGRDVIALFPGEWRRDPASAYLAEAHHDVPWREPALVRDGIDIPWARRGWIARAWAALRPRAAAAAGSVRQRTDPAAAGEPNAAIAPSPVCGPAWRPPVSPRSSQPGTSP